MDWMDGLDDSIGFDLIGLDWSQAVNGLDAWVG